MLLSSEGIVFKTIKYAENSRIVKIYTREKGLQSYMVKGFNKKKGAFHPSLFNALSVLDFVGYDNPKKEIQILKEARIAYNYKSIPFDIRKSTVLIFLNEVLFKSIKEEEENESLYRFIRSNLVLFDEMESNFNDFYLYFLLHLTKYLGFFPQFSAYTEGRYFNLRESLAFRYR
jgi:DNA repair protein RecO (recombination protein O)